MGHTFGVFSKSVGNVTFGKMRSSLVEGAFHPNHPKHPESPNRPRAQDRYAGYQNPLLGDPGKGQIGRWQSVKVDSLEIVIDQMIEQFLRDKKWYAKVRCREALWNMYRRLEWWVNQQIDPQKNDYQRALLMVRDCIYKILKNTEQEGGTHHDVSLPVCPAPYYHHFSGYYLNHYDAIDKEVPTFDMRDLPLSDTFNGLFRYVSSTEDQEWQVVHSVGTNEMVGNENIMKLDVTSLKHGNSSKVTFQWRFKKQGFIRFKYLASTAPGDGLLFFINNNQVGGEWNQSSTWQEAKFFVKPGQTYKFDWFVRRMSDRRFGKNAVYIKDVECVEVVQSLDEQTPPDLDTIGPDAYDIPGWEWITLSDSSIISTFFTGINDNHPRKVQRIMDAECSGVFSFQYEMGVEPPPSPEQSSLFFNDEFTSRSQSGSTEHGSTAVSQHQSQWSLDGKSSSTQEDFASIVYNVAIGDDCTVDFTGIIEMICPPREIDHYEERTTQISTPIHFSFSGENQWTWKTIDGLGDGIYIEDPIVSGRGDAIYIVNLEADGWMDFSYFTGLRDTESLRIIINDVEHLVVSGDEWEENVRIPLEKGTNTIIFRILDSLTEKPIEEEYPGTFSYGSSRGKHTTPMGSYIDVEREWDTDRYSSSTDEDGSENVYEIFLNPGTTFEFSEELELKKIIDDSEPDLYETVFSEDFNKQGNYAPGISVADNWEWEDIVTRYQGPGHGGDGVLKVENKNGTRNRLYLDDVYLDEPGYVKFEYGGSFSEYENLQLYDNGRLIWTGNEGTSDPLGITVKVPLGSGKHSLKWVFEDYDEIRVPDTTNYVPPKKPDPITGGEVCYSAGTEKHLIHYNDYPNIPGHGSFNARRFSLNYTTSNSRKGPTILYYDGSKPIGIGTETNGRTISRNIYNSGSSITKAKYSERLKVYAGKGYDVPNSFDVPIKGWYFKPDKNTTDPRPIHYDNTYVLTSEQVQPNKRMSKAMWYAAYDSIGNEDIFVEFEYLFYTHDLNNGQSNSNYQKYTSQRYLGRVLRGRLNNSNEITSTDSVFSLTYNQNTAGSIGKIQLPTEINNWDKRLVYGPKRLNNYYSPHSVGTYCVIFDFYALAKNLPIHGIGKKPYYLAIRNLKLTSTRPRKFSNDFDETKVEFTVRNSSGVVRKEIYSAGNTGVSEYFINIDIPQGRWYGIDYKLLKGKSYKGGLEDNGGLFTLSRGTVEETWIDYCIDKKGTMYPSHNSPYEPSTQPPTRVIIPEDSWCWIDTIEVNQEKRSRSLRSNTFTPASTSKSSLKAASKSYVRVRVYDDDNGTLLSDKKYADFDDVQLIKANIKNETKKGKNYSIRVKFFGNSDAEARLTNGEYTFYDKLPLPKSVAFVYDLKTTANVPIWMGGCNGSKIHVNVYDQSGLKIQTNSFETSDIHEFAIEGLSKPNISKVRVEILTEQRGEVSEWTGKEYLTTFKLRSARAIENWTITPSPFHSQLDFFIDGVKKGSYTNAGGTPTFLVDKGRHVFTWVFTAHGKGEVWDYCNIDFIKLTNWICDKVLVTPYCDPGNGDKCVEALIKCLLALWKERPEACVIGKRIWLFT
ncbi:hypothetical protein [Brevibacillus reuszeri]|uniref:hypothetical protein n=1 Tax=Brevibacillus reuszeri TaxID=54915 RepID=UPI003D1CAA58